MAALSLVGALIIGVAVAGLALQFGRRSAEPPAPVVDVEPDVEAVDPVAGVWEQPQFCQQPGIGTSQSEVLRRKDFPLPPPDDSWVTMETVGPRPLRIPPFPPRYDSIRK